MLKRTKGAGKSALAIALALSAVILVAGCSSMQSAITNALVKQPEPTPAPAPQEQAQAPAPAPKTASPGAAMAYQYQFNAFYGGMWNMGMFGFGDVNYKVGQGTVWTFTNTDAKGKAKDKDSVNMERALLKINADKSQWWRFKIETGKEKDTLLYEFLVGADTVVQKVRYQDPEGNIGEFIPDKGQQQPQAAPDGPRSRAEMAKYMVDKQKIQVKAGSFMTDHYLYEDVKGRGTSESWMSDKVPGYLVKSTWTSKKDNKSSSGELVQIESGVTTTLSSY
jgi:hypothetical protein